MSDRSVVCGALLIALSARIGLAVPSFVVAAAFVISGCLLVARRHDTPAPIYVAGAVAVALSLLVSMRAHRESAALVAPLSGTLAGPALIRSDPERSRGGLTMILELGHRRYFATIAEPNAVLVANLLVGDRIVTSGRTAPLRNVDPSWVASRHLAGRYVVRTVSSGPPARWWDNAANSLRRRLGAGAEHMTPEIRSLYLGLVIGDDRDQPPLMRHQFRASGLAHLLAVSGQNVAFALAAFSPALQRLAGRPRAVASLAILLAFVAVARTEPSVLRAVAMASVVILAGALGRPMSGSRATALAVAGLLVVDPLLIRSVGFRLSVAATVGLLVLSSPITELLPGPRAIRTGLGVSVAAQLATAPVLLAIAGGIPVLGPVANLLAVPAAGLVMIVGLTVGPLAGLLRPDVARVVQMPAELLVRWIQLVAESAARSPFPLLTAPRLAVVLISVVGAVLLRPHSRIVALLVALAGLVVATLPVALAPGVVDLQSGALLAVGECGGRVLVVDQFSGRADRLLDELNRRSIRRVDLLVVGPGRTGPPLARDIGMTIAVTQVAAARAANDTGVLAALPPQTVLGGVSVQAPPSANSERQARQTTVSMVPCTVGP